MKAIAFALLVVAGVIAAGAIVLQRREYTWEVAAAAAAGDTRLAFVRGHACEAGPCQSLWIGSSRETATRVATLAPGTEECGEIVWTPDGKRVAFLIDGYKLHVYDGETLKPAGVVTLVEPEGTPSARIARGVTFSENGRAVTFDDCPRRHSGCRSGLVGVPQ
jgi:hypothetical protein